MTYRERREAKAAKLSEWAAKREERAHAVLTSNPELRHDWAFITQPGHIPARARMNAADERAHESLKKAGEMTSRAFGINDQLDRSIYSDDADAIERLEERIAELEAKRERIKAENAAFRALHKDELKALTAFGRDRAMPHQAYELTNLGADIRRNVKRLEALRPVVAGAAPLKVIRARRDGACDRCSEAIEAGAWIGKYADGWVHLLNQGDAWTPACGQSVPVTVPCARCTRYELIPAQSGPTICGDCRADESRERDGWTPENSRD